ncbi:glycosyltransferase family 2 protein [Haloferula sargassicola]|uniref:Glycosyltransferase 2-like domain-containing protein n=1 Tax=Haloferula sargassicola TaxID=490096 RepID=A0ABP9US48_9BACT
MSPRVSVVLPFRDAQETLAAAVESVLAQDEGDFELLAVDDGSVDHSRRVVEAFSDRRIRLLNNQDAPGIVGALMTGVRAARSGWIARMDADDVSHPERLRLCLDRAEAGDEPGVVSGRVRLTSALGEGMQRYVDWVNGLADHEAISRARFIECPLVHPSTLIRRSWLERVGGYRDRPWAEDHDLWLRLLAAGCRFARIAERVLDWRDSPKRATRSDPRYGDKARIAMRAQHLAQLEGIRKHGAWIAGAGPTGKRLRRALAAEGVRIHGFAEVHPRRIGQKIHGLPVHACEPMLALRGRATVIGAAGGEAARIRLRRWAGDAGLIEGGDFWQAT